MDYYLFLDESGDHGLARIDPGFPVFVLSGVLFARDAYMDTGSRILMLKNQFWPEKKVILHSSDIRKCEKEFSIFFDLAKKAAFYTALNSILSEGRYTIISAGVQKENYHKKYGNLGEDVYQVSLSYIIERLVFFMNDIHGEKRVAIYIEKRGKKEDALLATHLQKILARGTYYVSAERLQLLIRLFKFYEKKQDIIGLQIADLIAYPTARYIIDPEQANPAFEIIEDKFYAKNGKRYGLKLFP